MGRMYKYYELHLFHCVLYGYLCGTVEENDGEENEGSNDTEDVANGLSRLALRIHPIEGNQEEVLEQDHNVLSVGRERITLQEVVNDARKEGSTLHIEGDSVQTGHVPSHHDLEDLRKLHNSRSNHNSIPKSLANGVLQTRNIRETAIHKECMVTLVSNHVRNQLFHVLYS